MTTGARPSIRTLATIGLNAFLAACSQEASETYTGYVEADNVYIAAPASGWIVDFDAQEGDLLSQGSVLFQLDTDLQVAALDEAKSQYDKADALARDLETGARDEELNVLEAELAEAEANLKLAKAERERWTQLAADGVASIARRDQVVAEEESAKARVDTLRRNIEVAKLAARDAAQEAAIANRRSAAAALAQAEWHLDQRRVTTQTGGRVEEIFHRRGEYVSTGSPVAALLPPENIKVRFFVPQDDLSRIALGQTVSVSSDVTNEPVTGVVSFIASEAEFTPPVIYSVQSRDKLTFMVEARLNGDTTLRPGQPVDVGLP